MMRTRRRKPGSQEQERTARELEALRIQINQIQGQVNYLSQVSSQLGPHSLSGLHTLGTVLYYFLFLPLHWLKLLLFLPFRLIRLLKDPDFYWTGLYWLWFTQVVIQDGGLKEVLISLRHPRRLARSIGLFQQ